LLIGLAAIYSAYPPEFFSTPIRIEAGRELTTPCFAAKPGPKGTIAKEIAERKEESQKRLEKCGFFRGVWKSPLKQRVASDFEER
jgi:hypothetical protein